MTHSTPTLASGGPARWTIAAMVLGLCCLAATWPSRATEIKLSSDQELRYLQDVGLRNRAGEQLYLGYKLSFHWFGLPYRVSNDGYVLAVKGKKLYYPLATKQIEEWQAQGHLPGQMPDYGLGTGDFMLGYLLWISLGLMAAWVAFRSRGEHKVENIVSPVKVQPIQRQVAAARPKLATPAANTNAPGVMPRQPVSSMPLQPALQHPALQSAVAKVQSPVQPGLPAPPARPASVQADVAALRVAKTLCRVKIMKVA